MSYITIKRTQDLDFVINDSIYLSGNENTDIDQEIYNNCWHIMFSDKQMKKIDFTYLQNFIIKLLKHRMEQIEKLNIKTDVTFYMWVGEMPMQLCFNLISGKPEKLPFGCNLKIHNSYNQVLNYFLQESKKVVEQGCDVPYADLVLLKPGDPDWDKWDDNDGVDPNYVLDVFVMVLPQSNIDKFLRNLV